MQQQSVWPSLLHELLSATLKTSRNNTASLLPLHIGDTGRRNLQYAFNVKIVNDTYQAESVPLASTKSRVIHLR